ncbi:MAG: isoprenylcysteine carboxylmethyltransferase family protein [Parasphingorhabdus sp.]|uniref:methyltransferase family protein n=1 Tax=Parasphingorhabdus sp. TaxID=2709688 RepID=UPI0030032892
MRKLFHLEEDSAQVKFPPPFVYIGFLLTGLVIDRWTGPICEFMSAAGYLPFIGIAVILAGLFFMIAGTSRFRQLGNNLEPWKPTNQIVRSGIYRYTRNPMYLGMALTYLGLTLVFHSPWALILLPVVIIVIRTQVIAREEHYLETKFGSEYLDYKKSVRRWV